MEKNVKVCVTGGAGYLASYLVNQLLQRGYTVHATLRNLGDESKVGLLKSFANADTRLRLFEADIYNNPHEFASAVEGCEFVVHMATPLQHDDNSQYKNTSEAAVAGVKRIIEGCLKSNTVKKLIYTASVVAASPLKDDGSGYMDAVDETCWTSLNLSNPYSNEFLDEYVHSKTLAEKEVLSYNGKGFEVVSLALGLVGGGMVRSSMAGSMETLISQVTSDGFSYNIMRYLEELMAKVPIVHIRDVTEAHIFSIENSNVNGRFLCASAYIKSAEIASLLQKYGHKISNPQGFVEDTKTRETIWGSTKLEDMGFQYKFDTEKTIQDSLLCAKRMGVLSCE